MTRREKEILAKDLSGRLGCGLLIEIEGCADEYLTGMYHDNVQYGEKNYYVNKGYDISRVKPYLLPMSSMTERQREEERHLKEEFYSFDSDTNILTLQDFYNRNHLDFRGLITLGLAVDATDLNFYSIN